MQPSFIFRVRLTKAILLLTLVRRLPITRYELIVELAGLFNWWRPAPEGAKSDS